MIEISEIAANLLINALWQITAIALIAYGCSSLMRAASARHQHVLWLVALVLSVALPVLSVTGVTSIFVRQLASVSSPVSVSTPNRSSVPVPVADESFEPVNQSNSTASYTSDATSDGNAAPAWQNLTVPPNILLGIGFAYLLFLMYRTLRLWQSLRKTLRLKKHSFSKDVPERLLAVAAECCAAFRIPFVPLRYSRRVSAPGIIGLRRPIIILPESFDELPDESLFSILGHELAHVTRRDFQLNLICELLLLPFSFHPLAIIIKQQIDRTRELACDEMVTDKLVEPVVHARSLLSIAGALMTRRDQALTLGIFNANILEERIMRLTRSTRRAGLRLSRVMVLTSIVLLITCCLTISTFSFGFQAAQQSDPAFASVVGLTETTLPNLATGETKTTAPSTRVVISQSGLRSADAQERALAACEAGRENSLELLPQLVSMLADDTQVQPIRCWVSGRWSPALSTFKHPSPGEQAAIALASMGPAAFEALRESLAHSNSVVRRNAAWAIGELTNMPPGHRDSAVAPLIGLLSDSDSWVRMASARALGELRPQQAGEPLIIALSDSNGRVRQLSAWALGEMKDARAVSRLSSLLISDSQGDVRLAAAEALGEIRKSEALGALNQALTDSDPRVRLRANWAIAEINDVDG